MVQRLSNNVKNLLNKSKESCLLAVDVYNKPLTSFKSGAYIVLMIIAWTSLLHAVFERDGINYYKKEKNNYFYERDDTGEKIALGLKECMKLYFKSKDKKYYPIRENLNIFIKIRNQIEHRFMPLLDELILGECQSLLNNYEKIFLEEFGEKYFFDESLSFSLQFSYMKKIKRNIVPSKEYIKIKKEVLKFRENLPPEIFSSELYSYKVFLIKTNNTNIADYAINFIHEKDLDKNTLEGLNRAITITHEKKINVSNKGNLISKDVCHLVEEKLSDIYGVKISFNHFHLNKCCNEFRIKFEDKNGQKRTNTDYCVFDDVFERYSYNPKIVNYLLKKFEDKHKFVDMFPSQKQKILNLFSTNQVTDIVQRKLSEFYKFDVVFGRNYHNSCCKFYKIRPVSNENFEVDEKFCYLIENCKFAYTEDWIKFLTNELKDKDNYMKLFPNQRYKFEELL